MLLSLTLLPAAAETFTASNGVISIELPSENWKEIKDAKNWIALSDGGNLITINHYSNGESLPDIAVADDHYVNVYQAVYSTQNEVFIITGYALDTEKIPDICNAIISTKVLKYDTKLAVKKDSPAAGEFTINPINRTMYTTDGVNVRSGCSTADQIIGAFAQGASIKVIGSVQRNGKDYGWYQVEYGTGVGYVASEFLTETAPAETNTTTGFTGRVKTIYAEDGTAVTVYEANDGIWRDSAGNEYNWMTNYEFYTHDGTVYTVNQLVSQSSGITPVGSPITAFWLTGASVTLTPYSDGSYYSSYNVQYWNNGNGTYSGADGTTLYAEMLPITDENVIPVTSDGSGRPSVITDTGEGLYDAEGNEYYDMGDGTYMDDYGATYDSVLD